MGQTLLSSEETLAFYERALDGLPSIEHKGKTTPYTSLNGHMFSFITKEGRLALRLSAKDRESFLKQHKSELCVQHGVVIQEYVVVPVPMLKQTSKLKKHFTRSLAYVGSLKPKATKRKSASGKQTAKGKAGALKSAVKKK